jgi:Lysine methyltransferase
MAQGGLCSPLLPLPLSHLHHNPYPHLQWDVVIGADVVWLEELVPLLVRALTALCGPDTLLLLAHQKRSERTDDLLFEGLSRDFEIEKV